MTDTDTAPAEAGDPMQDAEAWQALDPEEQDDILDEGLARLKGEEGEGHWRHLSAEAQQKTKAAIESAPDADEDVSETEAAMQAALAETWTAELWADTDDRPTIPFECRELSQTEQDIMYDGFALLAAIQQAGEDLSDPEEVDIEDVQHDSEYFDSVENFDAWLSAFLGDITVAEEFDEERFRTGRGMVAGTRGELLGTIFFRYEDDGGERR